MSDAVRCQAGEWVEIERVLLEPAERAPGLPEDTAAQPLRMWVKGFALAGGMIGDEIDIETMAGRTVRGHLSAIEPGYSHTFGSPPPEISGIGRDLRARIAAYPGTAGEPGAPGEPGDTGGLHSPQAGE